MPSHDVSIPKTSTSNDAKPYTLYHIALRLPSALRATIIQKRYSDFQALHSTLLSQVGAAPPSNLPAKSWFSRTVNNPELTESRRAGLEKYLKDIESSGDARWRNAPAYRDFLQLDDGTSGGDASRLGSRGGIQRDAITTSSDWLDAHSKMKSKLQEGRLLLSKREKSTNVTAQHEAGANAKKALVEAGIIIDSLEDGLDRLGGKPAPDFSWGAEKLGEGEIRRRRDLLSAARKEKEGLEEVLSAMAIRSAKASIQSTLSDAQASSAAAHGNKADLFKGSSGPKMGGRTLGGPPKETQRTRELDNEGVLQLQKQIMQEQDTDITDLTKVIRRMKDMGIAINEELETQQQMLDMLDEDVDRVDAKIRVAKKRVGQIS